MIEVLCDVLGKSTVGGSADEFHGMAGAAWVSRAQLLTDISRAAILCEENTMFPA